MLGSIYTGMSGMMAYSKGLNAISNNVANLNTLGYKGNDLLFQDRYYQYQLSSEYNQNHAALQLGTGVTAETTSIRFTQGEIRSTGNGTDTAIKGNGFFIIRDSGKTYYSRAGQFEFNADGYLVERGGQGRVAAFDANGNLTDINVKNLRTDAPKATSEVKFVNNLSTGSAKQEVKVNVYDTAGTQHALTVTFTNNNAQMPRSWLIEVKDENGNIIASDGEIRFQGNGSPEVDFNSYTFDFAPKDTGSSRIKLSFGEPGSFTSATSFSGGTTSDLAVDTQDGYGLGSLTDLSFNTEGVLTFQYSNGQSHDGLQLALADVDDPQSLKEMGNGRFQAAEGKAVRLAAPTKEGMGEIAGKSVELSNVDLTHEFTDMIVIQRGYQASSQILTTANEMMQRLIDMVRAK